MAVKSKLERLEEELAKTPGLVIGFSGGVDSSLLVTAAYKALGDKMLAVTIKSAFCPEHEMQEAKEVAGKIGFPHLIVEANPLSNPIVAANPADRCYHCKKMVFGKLLEIAKEKGFPFVADGTNTDDSGDYRPGMRAIEELKVVSPLKNAGLSKADIRMLSKELDLPTWEKESAACLASRIPYGEEITVEKLKRVELAEEYLARFNLKHLRVRSHGDLARIEVSTEDFPKLMAKDKSREISETLKGLGFSYVALDLQGYRTGSLNELLHK